jgi:dethiobiotin synthetase
VKALRLPVVLVVGLRLGCLNHAYLSARAIAADGCELAGWIASGIDPDMARADDNFALLEQRLPAACWGRLPHAFEPRAELLARHLRMPVDFRTP